VRGVDQQAEEIPRATSYEKRRSLDAAAAVERQRLKKRRARNLRTGSTAAATEPQCQSVTELSLVSMPVEPAYSMPWNSPACSNDQGAGFDGLDQDLSSTSSAQFCAHVAVDNMTSLEVGSQHFEPETHDTEDCEDGSRFVQVVEASGRSATAFFLFLNEFRKTFKEDHPDVKGITMVSCCTQSYNF
jgi:hypothetical protein